MSLVPLPERATLAELMVANTGQRVSREAFTRQLERRTEEDRLRQAVADLSQVFNDVKSSERLSDIGLMSGTHIDRPPVPRLSIFPEFNPTHQIEMRNNLEWYLSKHSDCRHLIITSGERVPIAGIRDRYQKLLKSLKKLYERKWFNEQIEVAFRSVEFDLKHRHSNLHVHLAVRSKKGRLQEDDWTTLCHKLRSYFGTVVRNGGPIYSEKLAGYFFKPESLAKLDSEQLLPFIEQVKGLKLRQPMASFKSLCDELQKRREKIAFRGNEMVRIRRSEGLRGEFRNHRTPSGKTPAHEPQNSDAAGEFPQSTTRFHNHIVRIGQPRCLCEPRKEPTLLVLNFDGNFEALLKANPQIQALRDLLLPLWNSEFVSEKDRASILCSLREQATAPDDSSFEAQQLARSCYPQSDSYPNGDELEEALDGDLPLWNLFKPDYRFELESIESELATTPG